MVKKITVIITAHDRKKFILAAVNSVLSQNIPRDDFEVLVIKNFIDPPIDNFLQEYNVKSIFTEKKSFGEKLAIGIENSSGEVISFLDDDDQFLVDKLENVMNAFRDSAVNYHHSSIESMDIDGRVRPSNLSSNIPKTMKFDSNSLFENFPLVMKFKGDWYVSAISARHETLEKQIELIRRSDTSLDRVIFIVCSHASGRLILDSNIDTRYRVHPSTTTLLTDQSDFIKKRADFYQRSFLVMEKLRNSLSNIQMEKVFELELLHTNLMRYFFSDEVPVISFFSLIRSTLAGLRYGIFVISYWSFLCLLRKIAPDFARRRFYNRTIRQFKQFIPKGDSKAKKNST